MSYPPHLLDELARVFARVALDRLLRESAAREPRQDGDDRNRDSGCGARAPKDHQVDDGNTSG
jgi:hypothetical protein